MITPLKESERLMFQDEGENKRKSVGCTAPSVVGYKKIQLDEMAEEGSKLLQYVAAVSGQ